MDEGREIDGWRMCGKEGGSERQNVSTGKTAEESEKRKGEKSG